MLEGCVSTRSTRREDQIFTAVWSVVHPTRHGLVPIPGDSWTQLDAALDELIEGGAAIVVLDASSIEFIDSTGLRSIVVAGNRLSERGGRLLIEGMTGAIQRVLEVTGLIDHYRLEPGS